MIYDTRFVQVNNRIFFSAVIYVIWSSMLIWGLLLSMLKTEVLLNIFVETEKHFVDTFWKTSFISLYISLLSVLINLMPIYIYTIFWKKYAVSLSVLCTCFSKENVVITATSLTGSCKGPSLMSHIQLKSKVYIHQAESAKFRLFYQVRGIIQNACYCLFCTDLNEIFHIKDVYM